MHRVISEAGTPFPGAARLPVLHYYSSSAQELARQQTSLRHRNHRRSRSIQSAVVSQTTMRCFHIACAAVVLLVAATASAASSSSAEADQALAAAWPGSGGSTRHLVQAPQTVTAPGKLHCSWLVQPRKGF